MDKSQPRSTPARPDYALKLWMSQQSPSVATLIQRLDTLESAASQQRKSLFSNSPALGTAANASSMPGPPSSIRSTDDNDNDNIDARDSPDSNLLNDAPALSVAAEHDLDIIQSQDDMSEASDL